MANSPRSCRTTPHHSSSRPRKRLVAYCLRISRLHPIAECVALRPGQCGVALLDPLPGGVFAPQATNDARPDRPPVAASERHPAARSRCLSVNVAKPEGLSARELSDFEAAAHRDQRVRPGQSHGVFEVVDGYQRVAAEHGLGPQLPRLVRLNAGLPRSSRCEPRRSKHAVHASNA